MYAAALADELDPVTVVALGPPAEYDGHDAHSTASSYTGPLLVIASTEDRSVPALSSKLVARADDPARSSSSAAARTVSSCSTGSTARRSSSSIDDALASALRRLGQRRRRATPVGSPAVGGACVRRSGAARASRARCPPANRTIARMSRPSELDPGAVDARRCRSSRPWTPTAPVRCAVRHALGLTPARRPALSTAYFTPKSSAVPCPLTTTCEVPSSDSCCVPSTSFGAPVGGRDRGRPRAAWTRRRRLQAVGQRLRAGVELVAPAPSWPSPSTSAPPPSPSLSVPACSEWHAAAQGAVRAGVVRRPDALLRRSRRPLTSSGHAGIHAGEALEQAGLAGVAHAGAMPSSGRTRSWPDPGPAMFGEPALQVGQPLLQRRVGERGAAP